MIEETITTDRPLLRVLQGERRKVPPIWLMRQAGRYLPEYRALRATKRGFLDLVHDSEAAAEVTLQPIERFGFDAAILFSDILVIPHALGQDLRFVEGEGPRLSPILEDTDLASLEPAAERLAPVYETVRRVRDQLDDGKALLGFAGSPWTVATYMVAGQGSRDQSATRQLAYRDSKRFEAIIDAIVDLTVDYLSGQIEAGADAVQLFDSWAGSLSPEQFERWVIAPTAGIVARLKQRHADLPVIGFPKGAGGKLEAYVRETGVDAIALDETVDPVWAASVLPDGLPVQGNLDPLALIAGGDELARSVTRIKGAFAGRPHVFNLGHGILPETPIGNVERLIALVRED